MPALTTASSAHAFLTVARALRVRGAQVVFMVLGIINPAGQACAKPPSAGVRLLANVSPIKWAVRSVVGAELRGMALERGSLRDAPRIGGLALATSGDEVLEQLGIMDDTPARCARRLAQLLQAGAALLDYGLDPKPQWTWTSDIGTTFTCSEPKLESANVDWNELRTALNDPHPRRSLPAGHGGRHVNCTVR